MITEECFSLRDTAEALDLESWRLARLGRYLHIMPGAVCIPRDVVTRAQAEADQERRYRIILDWLLANLQGNQLAEPDARFDS